MTYEEYVNLQPIVKTGQSKEDYAFGAHSELFKLVSEAFMKSQDIMREMGKLRGDSESEAVLILRDACSAVFENYRVMSSNMPIEY